MKQTKKRRLEKAGWKIGTTRDFLQLSDQEAALLEMRHQLAKSLRRLRQEQELTQEAVASVLGSSQSRVAKMEAGDSSVSLDLLVKANLALGCTRQQIGRILAR
ncbi:MAG: XRE family transcriptional regulator [Acidobacteria bacterium]|nr:MAG: XRE family transcriptional regulator [Acidobacteriota bacterium]REK06126.1 MAG: XRE family transcriptional regulator [Acidobacteriota bacterium]